VLTGAVWWQQSRHVQSVYHSDTSEEEPPQVKPLLSMWLSSQYVRLCTTTPGYVSRTRVCFQYVLMQRDFWRRWLRVSLDCQLWLYPIILEEQQHYVYALDRRKLFHWSMHSLMPNYLLLLMSGCCWLLVGFEVNPLPLMLYVSQLCHDPAQQWISCVDGWVDNCLSDWWVQTVAVLGCLTEERRWWQKGEKWRRKSWQRKNYSSETGLAVLIVVIHVSV